MSESPQEARSVAFDRAAGYYDETRGFPPGEDRAVAEKMARAGGLTPSARVLEVGVGTGRIALPLAAHVRLVLGVDLARPMLERLRAKQRGEPVRVVIGDATRLPVADGVCDAAVAVHIFHLIPDWRTALGEVARTLKPDGVLIAGYNEMQRSEGPAGVLWSAWDTALGSEREINVGVPRERYGTFMQDEGWRPLAGPVMHRFTTRRQIRYIVDEFERGVWSSTWRLSDEQRAAGLAAVRAAMTEHAINPELWIENERRFVIRVFAPPG